MIQEQTHTPPELRVTEQSPLRLDRRHRRMRQRFWHAFHGPGPDSERSDWCPQAFAYSPRALTTRAASAAAFRISANDIFFPFSLARMPLSERIPGCTRIVARSPSTSYSNRSPGMIPKAFRILPGIVVCPLLVTVECMVYAPYYCTTPYIVIIPYLLISDKDRDAATKNTTR